MLKWRRTVFLISTSLLAMDMDMQQVVNRLPILASTPPIQTTFPLDTLMDPQRAIPIVSGPQNTNPRLMNGPSPLL